MVSFPQGLTDLRLSCVLASGLIEINLGEGIMQSVLKTKKAHLSVSLF